MFSLSAPGLCVCFVLAYLPAPEENIAGEHSDWPASLTCPSRADSVFKEKAGGEEGLLGGQTMDLVPTFITEGNAKLN